MDPRAEELAMIEVRRDAGLSGLIPPEAEVETLAGGFEATEGPLWFPDGSLLFQDRAAGRTHRIAHDGSLSLLRDQTRGANGQTFDAQGRIVFCEQDGRRVSRMNPDGSGVETVVETFKGKRLNSPNDIVCRSDGLLFFTDPPYGAPPDRPLHFQGVFALDRAGQLTLLVDDFEKPNGLAFSPDEKTLYINDTARYHVRAFEVRPSGRFKPGSGRVLATVDPAEQGGPDGIKVDREGRLYLAVAEGIWVFGPSGRLLGILALPKRPFNLCWCGEEANTLAITAGDSVFRVRLNVRGIMPPFLHQT
jgi:gluconolactonase